MDGLSRAMEMAEEIAEEARVAIKAAEERVKVAEEMVEAAVKEYKEAGRDVLQWALKVDNLLESLDV